MIIRCAWCGNILGEKPPYEDKSFTDGICDKCLTVHFPHHADKIISILGEERERAGISPPEEKQGGNPAYQVCQTIELCHPIEASSKEEALAIAIDKGETDARVNLIKDWHVTRKEGNPARVRFDRADIDSAIAAAKQLKSEKDLYVFATYLGYTIDGRPPPGMQSYVIVHPDGSTETIKPSIGENPSGVYVVDGVEVTIRYIRPGVHEVSFLAPKELSEETLAKIDKLIKEKTIKPSIGGNPGMVPDKRLLKVAIEREPLKVARQLRYEVHRLSPTDIVDKADYASGYRFRLSKAIPNQPYPQIVMARSEGEVATFLKRQTEEGNPTTKDERLAEEIARFIVAKRKPTIKADELETIFKESGYGDKELSDFTSYIGTPEGRDFFRKTIRLELWKAGYHPKGEKL